MNFRKLALALSVCTGVLLAALPVGATDPNMSEEEMMKKWMEISTPSEGHKLFDKYVGKWDATVKSWMDPAAPPTESKGMCEFSKMLGGRFLQQDFKGQMMGMPFEGHGMTGFDNFRKEYVTTWMDNFSTSIMKMTGTMKDSKTMEMTGMMDEPMTGEKDKKIRMTETWTDDDHFTFAMFDNIPGKGEVKMMEIMYSRAK